jgi:hypothetical protein
VAIVIKKDVLWLEITVHHVESVQVFESKEQLGAVETTALLTKALLLLQVVEEFSSVDEAAMSISM